MTDWIKVDDFNNLMDITDIVERIRTNNKQIEHIYLYASRGLISINIQLSSHELIEVNKFDDEEWKIRIKKGETNGWQE